MPTLDWVERKSLWSRCSKNSNLQFYLFLELLLSSPPSLNSYWMGSLCPPPYTCSLTSVVRFCPVLPASLCVGQPGMLLVKPLVATLWKSYQGHPGLVEPLYLPCSYMTLYGNVSCICGFVLVEECAVKPIKSPQKCKNMPALPFALSHCDS